jgi:predicted RNase H-like HicB family nuclease
MNVPILYERIIDKDFPEGYYYAHIPTMNLTTHGKGIQGAQKAALDLIRLWLDEKKAHDEMPDLSDDFLFSTIEV